MVRSAIRGVAAAAILLGVPACGSSMFVLPPDAFSLADPAPAAVGVSRSPTFSWTPSLQATSYSLQVATDAAFATLLVDDSGIPSTTRAPLITLAASTVYYWRVFAVNSVGIRIADGAPRSFTTVRPAILMSGGPLTFAGSSAGPSPPSQSLSISNPTGASTTLAWTASSDRPWLQVSPGSGTTTTETDTLTITAVIVQTEAWTSATSTVNAPNGQEDGTAVWTGAEMIVWGGHGPVGTMVDTGGRYDPIADAWTSATSTSGAPSPRWGHSAVWTGTEMIVWGGAPGGGPPAADGYRYNPATDSWSGPISSTGAPSARRVHTAVWTGSEMVVWGGLTAAGTGTDTGARYNPTTDTWTSMSMAGAPPPAAYHTAVWTGSRMLVCGNTPPGQYYYPVTDSWGASISTTGAPVRDNPCAVWTGSELLLWSGWDGSTQPDTGARYDPLADVWTPMTTTNAPAGRRSGAAVWTGSEMIIWGGFDGAGYNNLGKRYVPPRSLAPGVYTGTVTVTDPTASNSPQTVGVTLTVGP